MEPLHRRFAKVVRERCGVVMLSRAEQAVRQEIATLPMTLEANALLRILAELSFCCKYGQKRLGEVCDEGCHYTHYLCYEVRNCASNRLPGSVYRYAQALAWWCGSPHVDVEHIRTICRMPWHIGPNGVSRTSWHASMSGVRSPCCCTRPGMPRRQYFTVSTSNATTSWRAWVPQRARW